MCEYMVRHVFWYNFSNCDRPPGMPLTTNALERKHLDLKSVNYFNSVEGAGNVLTQSKLLPW